MESRRTVCNDPVVLRVRFSVEHTARPDKQTHVGQIDPSQIHIHRIAVRDTEINTSGHGLS